MEAVLLARTITETKVDIDQHLQHVESVLEQTIQVANKTCKRMQDNEEQLDRVHGSVEAAKMASKRSHKLLSRLSWWQYFGSFSSRAAGRRGQKIEEARAAYRLARKKRNKVLDKNSKNTENNFDGERSAQINLLNKSSDSRQNELLVPQTSHRQFVSSARDSSAAASTTWKPPEWLYNGESDTPSTIQKEDRLNVWSESQEIGCQLMSEDSCSCDRIDSLLSQLLDMSGTMSIKLKEQNTSIKDLDRSVTDVLKSSQAASARSDWHRRRC